MYDAMGVHSRTFTTYAERPKEKTREANPKRKAQYQ